MALRNNRNIIMANPKSQDNFLADVVHGRSKHITYQDGFRFGVGFSIGIILVTIVVGVLAYSLLVGLRLK